MQCIGRTRTFRRCKNKTTFIVCKTHRYQLMWFLVFTIPTLIITYLALFQNFIRPIIIKEDIPIFIVNINESITRNELVHNELYWNDHVYDYLPNKLTSSNHIDTLLLEIIDLYEKRKRKEATKLIESYFQTQIDSFDKYLGYIVAVYFNAKIFDKAAEIVLKRNKYRKQWDYSLKLDYAKCIRYYTLSNTLNEGIELVNNHNLEYKAPIISYFWTSIPYDELMANIENGIHSVPVINRNISNNRLKEISYLIEKYPNDPFLSYGYYLTGNFGKALECEENRIYDLCLYAYAYDNVRKISKKYSFINSDYFQYLIPEQPINNERDKELMIKSIKVLKEYVLLYPSKAHADDSAFWIAWLYSFLGNYADAYNWLDKCKNLGNGDYSDISINYKVKLSAKVSVSNKDLFANLINDFKEIEKRKNTFNGNYLNFNERKLIYTYLNKLSVEEIKELFNEKELDDIIYQYMYLLINNGDYNRALELFVFLEESDALFFNKINKKHVTLFNIIDEVNKINTSKDQLVDIILSIKNEYNIRKLALNLIDIGIEKYKLDQTVLEYLYYLKIRILTIYNPIYVEREVNMFISNFPDSKYADDVLAELILVNLKVLNFPNKAIKKLNLLLENYPNGNACDNALNCLADYYQKYCDDYYPDWNENCLNAIDINNIIINYYPESSYFNNAKRRKNKCIKILKNNSN